MGWIQPLIGLHGLYYLYMGVRYLWSFLSTREIIYLYPSTGIIFGAVLVLSAIGLESKKLISYYGIIVVYSILLITRTVSGMNHLISNGFDSITFLGLVIGNISMLGICYYTYKEKNKVINKENKA